MMSNMEKAQRLQMAVALLQDADAMIQGTLGATDECYEVHNAIESIIDDVQGFADMLEEMQITD